MTDLVVSSGERPPSPLCLFPWLQKCYIPRCPVPEASPVETPQMSLSATAGTRVPSWPGEKGRAGGWGLGPGQSVDPLPCSLLKVHLQLHGFSVFIDVEKLEAGKFEDKLIQSVMAARNFVLVLSAGALDKCMQDHDCKDWVHKVGADLGLCADTSPGVEGSRFSLTPRGLLAQPQSIPSSVFSSTK